MKLALFTPNYAPHFEGGTERVVRAQARELARLGHEVRVVSGTHRPHAGADQERSLVDGIPVVHVAARPEEHFDIALLRPRVTALGVELAAGADLVHVHHWIGFGMDLCRSLVAAAPERPVVVTYHDLFATCTRSFRASPLAGLECPPRGVVEPCATCLAPDVPAHRTAADVRASLAARIEAFEAEARVAALRTAPSRTHARAVERLLGLAAGDVVPLANGLCSAVGSPAARRETWDGSRPLRVLHIGHRTAAKGTLDLVRALAALPAGATELHLAGTEVEAGFDASLVEAAGSAVALVFHGGYAPEQLAGRVGHCDLAAFPSRAAESYGLVVDEALALGLPVWVSDRGALHERVGAAGCSLPAENPPAWTSAFRQLLDNPRALAGQRAAVPERLPTGADAARVLHEHYLRLVPTK